MTIQHSVVATAVIFTLLIGGAVYAEKQAPKKMNKGQQVKEVQMKKNEVKKDVQAKKKEIKKEVQMKKKEVKKQEVKKSPLLIPLPVVAPLAVPEQKPEQKIESKPETVVLYTSDGFSPSSSPIKKGETVVFKNESNQQMWVASASHPVHTLYPEFDQRGIAEKGGSYSFMFDKTGTWKYHDHMNPSRNGTIVVTE